MKLLFCIRTVLFIWVATAYSQKVTYLDENDYIINESQYVERMKSDIYYGLSYFTDSVTYRKTYLSYRIGILGEPVRKKLFEKLENRFKLDTGESMYIHYFKKPVPKLNSIDTLLYGDSLKHKRTFWNTTFREHRKKCRTSRGWNKIEHIEASGESMIPGKKQEWVKDYDKTLAELFLNEDTRNTENTIYIRPDGSYFVVNVYMREETFNNLLKNKNWDQHQQEFEKEYRSLNPGPNP